MKNQILSFIFAFLAISAYNHQYISVHNLDQIIADSKEFGIVLNPKIANSIHLSNITDSTEEYDISIYNILADCNEFHGHHMELSIDPSKYQANFSNLEVYWIFNSFYDFKNKTSGNETKNEKLSGIFHFDNYSFIRKSFTSPEIKKLILSHEAKSMDYFFHEFNVTSAVDPQIQKIAEKLINKVDYLEKSKENISENLISLFNNYYQNTEKQITEFDFPALNNKYDFSLVNYTLTENYELKKIEFSIIDYEQKANVSIEDFEKNVDNFTLPNTFISMSVFENTFNYGFDHGMFQGILNSTYSTPNFKFTTGYTALAFHKLFEERPYTKVEVKCTAMKVNSFKYDNETQGMGGEISFTCLLQTQEFVKQISTFDVNVTIMAKPVLAVEKLNMIISETNVNEITNIVAISPYTLDNKDIAIDFIKEVVANMVGKKTFGSDFPTEERNHNPLAWMFPKFVGLYNARC